MAYEHVSTVNDIMKETLIYGAELTKGYGFPILECTAPKPTDTVDFKHSLKLNKVKNLNINFFVHDTEFLPVFNNPDKYMNHFKCFQSICGTDFSIDIQSPLALQIYNKYRNHVLSWYFQHNGVKLIPKVNILPNCSNWIYDGLPYNSMLCCSTNGRNRNELQRKEFRECFAEMESILKPHTVVIVGAKIDIETKCDIIWLESAGQKLNRKMGRADCAT